MKKTMLFLIISPMMYINSMNNIKSILQNYTNKSRRLHDKLEDNTYDHIEELQELTGKEKSLIIFMLLHIILSVGLALGFIFISSITALMPLYILYGFIMIFLTIVNLSRITWKSLMFHGICGLLFTMLLGSYLIYKPSLNWLIFLTFFINLLEIIYLSNQIALLRIQSSENTEDNSE